MLKYVAKAAHTAIRNSFPSAISFNKETLATATSHKVFMFYKQTLRCGSTV